VITTELDRLPVNTALLQLVGAAVCDSPPPPHLSADEAQSYLQAKRCIEELALYLKPFSSGIGTGVLSRPMQRKLVTLINCQLVEGEGRSRAMRAARSLGERTVTELILQHQNPQQLSANLWAAVRARGCQFLGPAMQEEVLKLVLLALEDGSALSRKVLVMFVVQRLEPHFPQASKTSIGHVVQLLYRASCFKVSKREGDSSLMQLKEEFRTYEALRREHDAQIVQIATEAGLRIAPDQWSALLYGDTAHKSHMQSIIDKLQTPQSFAQSVQELVIALQRTNDPGNLSVLRPPLELLAAIDTSPECSACGWAEVWNAVEAARQVVAGLVEFIRVHGARKPPLTEGQLTTPHPHSAKYKISLCRDLGLRGNCPRGANCTFAHSEDELEKYRSKSRKVVPRKEEDFLADSLFSHPEEVIFSPQPHTPFNPTTGARMPEALFPLKSPAGFPAMISHPFPPEIYSAAPHSMVLSTGGQLYAPQPDYASPAPPQTEHRPIEPAHTHTHAWLSLPPAKVQRYNNKNLVMLQQRKQEIVSQLERNKCNTPLRSDPQTSTYSMWSSGGMSSGPNSQVSTYRPVLYRSESGLTDDEFIPFEPGVSKYGPISRARPVQSSAVFTEAAVSPGVPAPFPPGYGQGSGLVSPSLSDYIFTHGLMEPLTHDQALMVQLKNIEKLEKHIKKIKQQKQEIMEKEKNDWRFSQMVPSHGGVGGWASSGYHSDDEDDGYDIAHNMRELELTLQGSLEEEESKLWPRDDDAK